MGSALALVLVGAQASGAPSDERPRVSIAVVGCAADLAREAQRITAIELRAALVDTAPDQTTTQITATCNAESVDLRVIDPTTGKSVERSVALAQAAPPARARLLALAMAELVAASWAELEDNPEPKVAPVTPLAPKKAREAARGAVAPMPIELGALADAHLLASRDLLLGGGARAAIWISPRLFMRFDALVHYAELSRPTGTIALTMPSVSTALGASFGTAWLQPRLSIGARAGYAWLSGVAGSSRSTGGQQQAPWAGPELSLELSAWPRARVHPLLCFSVGAHIFGVRGMVNGGQDVTATGLWGGLSLGAAIR
ncbi:MAG: hypothetical protein ABJB12_01295 [Pseudomonadota bacterium]